MHSFDFYSLQRLHFKILKEEKSEWSSYKTYPSFLIESRIIY
jgi:hypothetical protein